MTNVVPAPVTDLLEVAERVVPNWLRRLAITAAGPNVDPTVEAVLMDCQQSLLAGLRSLLAQDVEAQRVNPLTLFRAGTGPLTACLVSLGVAPAHRDRFAVEHFPDDVYGFSPATWADIDPELASVGMAWGAWKAMTVIKRHRQSEPGA